MNALDLLDVYRRMEDALESAFEEPQWVRAEINQLMVRNGHCYMELVQRDAHGTGLLAKARGTVWADVWRMMGPYFEKETDRALQAGLQVLLQVSPRLHPLYGLSLTVYDVDPAYTLGLVEQDRRRTLERLEKEGLIDKNRQWPTPLLPMRLAVISTPEAAGFQDFLAHLHASPFAFTIRLFPSLMQGTDAVADMKRAFAAIAACQHDFDMVLVLRGGGATTDLHCYDDYDLAACIARFPLPVMVGVGHQRDSHIADRVAHLSVKTPTAAADWLIDRMTLQDQQLLALGARIVGAVQDRLQTESDSLSMRRNTMCQAVERLLTAHAHALDLAAQRIEQNNPLVLLERGYSITLFEGKALRHADRLKADSRVEVLLQDGRFTATVDTIN